MTISKQLTHFGLRISTALAILGVLFKLMHWYGGAILLVTGCLGIAIFYSLRFSQKKDRSFLDHAKLFVLLSFLLHYSFNVFHWPYGYLFTILAQFGLLLLLIAYVCEVFYLREGTAETEEKKGSKIIFQKRITRILQGLGTITIIAGALLKILHWEVYFVTGNMLLFIGLSVTAVVILLPLLEK